MAKRKRVLVVEDEAQLRDIIAGFLHDEGFLVDTASTGVEALECIARQPPDLMLLDMQLPVMDGRAVIRELRASGLKLPIVVMTGAQDARQTAREVGAAAYVAKPLALPLLLARIDAIAA